MEEGLYELLVSAGVRRQLAELGPEFEASITKIDDADLPRIISQHIAEALARHVTPSTALKLVNDLLRDLADEEENTLPDGDVSLLRAIEKPAILGTHRSYDQRPTTPLREAALLTNAPDEPSLGPELRAELVSADSVDLLCAFVMWPGIRLLEQELRQLRTHNVPIRIITSTYTGSTDRRTIDKLVEEFGAQVKVHYETKRTRLHAKAWLFRRHTGFDTGYVGSSNLSSSALLDGVEWNVRISQIATPTLMRKFDATFESYWNDPDFETYDPARDAERLDRALDEAAGKTTTASLSLSGLQVTPFPHQRVILDQLEAERVVHGRHRNLVVAATGTGKTVVAALDYARLCDGGLRPSLLFVAHRTEILQQARRAYGEVLNDANFGEFLVGGHRPRSGEHVFASIQSLLRTDLDAVDPAAYDVIVIDEFHHAGAASYRRILSHFTPRELLGLTATPERGDGLDIRDFFDGRTAAEVRLWDALAAELLTPFHYFGVHDIVDLRSVRWISGRYDREELDARIKENADRARHVLRQLEQKITDIDAMKALAFCTSTQHAQFMADYFTEHGIPSLSVTSAPGAHDRVAAVDALRRGEVKALFTVDMFNEGIDIPAVNTVLFLRPTESPTIFVQQLGRGLRLAANKPVLTALDFVGHQRTEYRWDRKLRAIAKNMTRRELISAIHTGFSLPGGSQVILDEVARERILANVKKGINSTWRSLVAEARDGGISSLKMFLDDAGVDLSDVLKNDRSWTTLRREAEHDLPPAGPAEPHLVRRVRALVHVDDAPRNAAYLELLTDNMTWRGLSANALRHAPMLFFSLWPDGGGFTSIEDGFAALAEETAVRAEMREVLCLTMDTVRHKTLVGTRPDLPLRVHATYTREELLAAIGYADLARRRMPRQAVAGVFHVPENRLDALLVTTVKTEAGFSPTTMYRDYAVSRSLMHWESQAAVRADSDTGLRYQHHAERDHDVLLFARQHKVNDFGGGAPFVFLGAVSYVKHSGERPMGVTWKLRDPMPETVFAWASVTG